MNIVSRSKNENFCLFKKLWNAIENYILDNGKACMVTDNSIENLNKQLKSLAILLEDSLDVKDISNDPFFDFFLTHDSLHKLFIWSLNSGRHFESLKTSQLQIYQVLLSNYHQKILIHKPVLRPLLKLIKCCGKFGGSVSHDVERRLVFVLNEISGIFHRERGLFDFYLTVTSDSYKFLFVSTLVSFIQREDEIGQLAKNSLLFYTSLSTVHEDLARFIEEKSNFSAVSAATLGCLYSNITRSLDWPPDHPHRISKEAVVEIDGLLDAINFLQFLDVAIQKIHPRIREQLVTMVYQGFLKPVLGQCLRQDIRTGYGEVITATAYLEVFLRHIRHPSMVGTFVDFLLGGENGGPTFGDIDKAPSHLSDGTVTGCGSMLDLVVSRLGNEADERMKLVNLSLLYTLLDLNCEDVMMALFFRYLIPCGHIMTSHVPASTRFDIYGEPCAKFLSLKPNYGRPDGDVTIHDGTESSGQSPVDTSSHPPSSYLGSYAMDARRAIFLCRRACRPAQGGGETYQTFHHNTSSHGVKRRRGKVRWLYAYTPQVPGSRVLTHHESRVSFIRQHRLERGDSTCSERGGASEDYARLTSASSSSTSSSGDKVAPRAKSGSIDSEPLLDSRCSQGDTSPPLPHLDLSPILDSESKFREQLSTFPASDHNIGSTGPSTTPVPSKPVLVERRDAMQTFFRELDSYTVTIDSDGQDSLTLGDASLALTIDRLLRIDDDTVSGRRPLPLPNFKQNCECQDPREAGKDLQGRGSKQESSLTQRSTVRDSNLSASRAGGGGQSPDIGPLLNTLFGMTEDMIKNSLFLNLHLTGLMTRLSSYPQPILQSLLLNCTVTVQPGVKSLIKVLSIVKTGLEEYATTLTNELYSLGHGTMDKDPAEKSEEIFQALKNKAKRYLALRERIYREKLAVNRWGPAHKRGTSTTTRAPPHDSEQPYSTHRDGPAGNGTPFSSPEYVKPFEILTGDRRVFDQAPDHSILDVARGENLTSGTTTSKSDNKRLQIIGNWTGYKFINKKAKSPKNLNPNAQGDASNYGKQGNGYVINNDHSVSSPENPESSTASRPYLSLRTKNAIYCAVIFEEFLKELAAMSQEMALSQCAIVPH